MTDNRDPLNRTSDSHRHRTTPNPGSTEVERYPIHYSPASVADVNRDALPSMDDLRGMELAYCEQPLSEDVILHNGQLLLATITVGTLVAAFATLLLASVLSFATVLPLTALPVFLLIGTAFRDGTLSVQRLLVSVLAPPVVVLLLYALATITSHRIAGYFVFGTLTFLIALCCTLEIGTFLRDWMLTHPRLRPLDRRAISFDPADAAAASLIPFLLLSILLGFCALKSNTLAMIAVSLAAIITANGFDIFKPGARPEDCFGLSRTARYAHRLISHWLMYGSRPSGAAGVWQPAQPPFVRRLQLIFLLGPFVLFLTSTTSGFSVWDFPGIREKFTDTLRGSLEAETPPFILLRIAPTLNLTNYPQRPEPDYDATQFARDYQLTVFDRKRTKFCEHALRSSAALWIVVLAIGVSNGELWMLWIPVVSVVFSLVLTTLFSLACLRPVLKAFWKFETQLVKRFDHDQRPIWQCFVDRLRESRHELQTNSGDGLRERDHLFFGISAVTDYPVLLHRTLFDEHCYIVGQTGSGKTSLGIMPLLLQFIRGSAGPPSDDDGTSLLPPVSDEVEDEQSPAIDIPIHTSTSTPDDEPIESETVPLVVLDLKGDPGLFHTLREEAAARGQEFRFFTPERGLATHVFNPFSNFESQNRSLLQLCQLILDALGLNHGEGYGRSYFTRQNREALFDALSTDPPPKTFKELNEVLKSFRGRPNYPDIFELVSTIHALTQYPQLETIEPVSDPATSIHMPTVLERRQVVYFWLPAAIESITVREVGKLALFSLLSAVIDRQRAGLDTRRTYLFIDEFQRLAGENFRIVLEQARSYGLSCIMANQTQADLNLPSIDLRPTVRTNTRVKMHFGVTDLHEVEELSAMSGQEIAIMRSGGVSESSQSASVSRNWNESLKNRLLPSDILSATDHPRRSILHVTRGSGYSQWGGLPTVVDCFHPITRELYVARSNTPWPQMQATPGTTTSEVDVSDIDRQRNRVLVQEQEETLSRMFDAADAKFRSIDQK